MASQNGGIPRLVCSASDLHQGHSLSSKYYRKQRGTTRDAGVSYIPPDGYDVASPYSPTLTVTDSDFSSQDLDSSGYFSAISSREFWDMEHRPDPYGIVRSAFELRDVKSKRKILTNGSLKQSCNNSTASSLNNSMGELKELKVHQPNYRNERLPIECTFKPIREPQTPEPMYPDHESDRGMTQGSYKHHNRQIIGSEVLSDHGTHPYHMEGHANHSVHSTSESGYSSQSRDSKDHSQPAQKDSRSSQKDSKSSQSNSKSGCKSSQNDAINYTSHSQVTKQTKGQSEEQLRTVSPQRVRQSEHIAKNNRTPSENVHQSNITSNITSSSRDIYEISRMVGSAKELSQRHQRKMSQPGRPELSLPEYGARNINDGARQSEDRTDISNIVGSAKDLIENASKESGRRQYRRRIDSREEEGPVVLIRSNENFQKYFRDYLLPVSVKEGRPTKWDYFIAETYPLESSTDPDEVFAANPCQSCPEFQQYGVPDPKPPIIVHPPGALQIAAIDLPKAPPAVKVKVTNEDICVAPDVLREPERPKPSSYMPLSIAVCMLCSVFAISTIVLSVRTQRALRRGENRKSRKLSHLTFWLNIGLAVFGAFTYLITIVVIYVVIHNKGGSIKLV